MARPLHLFVAIDRTSKFAYVELHQKVTTAISLKLFNNLVAAVPYTIHTVLTDNGIQFTDPTGESWTPADIRKMRAEGKLFRCHAFESGCATHNIDHRLTKPRHPWTNGQVERMNRTIKQATVHGFHYDNHDQLRQHLADFVNDYNFARRLKALKGLTPYEFICKCWTNQPERFNLNPIHQTSGLNICDFALNPDFNFALFNGFVDISRHGHAANAQSFGYLILRETLNIAHPCNAHAVAGNADCTTVGGRYLCNGAVGHFCREFQVFQLCE